MRYLPFALVLVLVPLDTRAAAAPPIPTVTRLVLAARVDFQKKELGGTETLRLENRSGAPLEVVPLDVNRLMRFVRASDASGPLPMTQEVSTFEDEPMRQVTHAGVTLRRPLPPGGTTDLTVEWRGHLVGYTETGSLYIRDSIDEAFTILRADAYAYPVVQTLSAAANRAAPRPGFTFDARVTVPSTHTVATGGQLVSTTTAGDETTYRFRSEEPVPFLNIAIARYAQLQRAGIHLYHFPEDAAGAEHIAERSEAALRLLTSWFGPLARKAEVTIIEIPDEMGSQADLHAGIIQTAAAFRDAAALPEVYHELSHFWSVSDRDSPSSRWSEGLAMYLQRKMAVALDGRGNVADRAHLSAERLVKLAASEPRLATVAMARYGSEGLTDYAYGTGFVMFYALERRIGEDALMRTVGEYYRRFHAGGAGFEELARVASEISGHDLGTFFDAWFRSTGWITALRAGRPVEQIGAERSGLTSP